MAHAFTAHATGGDFNPTLIADNALIAYPLVLATGTFPVLHWAKDALAEKTIALWTQRAIVDRFRLGDFPIAPLADLLG